MEHPLLFGVNTPAKRSAYWGVPVEVPAARGGTQLRVAALLLLALAIRLAVWSWTVYRMGPR